MDAFSWDEKVMGNVSVSCFCCDSLTMIKTWEQVTGPEPIHTIGQLLKSR